MKNVKISGLIMIMLVAMLSVSCSSDKSTEKTTFQNPELLKILKDADWAFWTATTGTEIKFAGEDKVIIMEWLKDPVSQAWNRTGSDVGTLEFLDENWFVVKYNKKSTAYLFTRSNSTFESSDGAIFGKNQINAFRLKK